MCWILLKEVYKQLLLLYFLCTTKMQVIEIHSQDMYLSVWSLAPIMLSQSSHNILVSAQQGLNLMISIATVSIHFMIIVGLKLHMPCWDPVVRVWCWGWYISREQGMRSTICPGHPCCGLCRLLGYLNALIKDLNYLHHPSAKKFYKIRK